MQQTRRRKKKKKLKYRRLYMLIAIIIAIILCIKLVTGKGKTAEVSKPNNTVKPEITNTAVPPEEVMPTSSILGQTLVTGEDGYVTKFTTTSSETPRTYTEYKQILGSWAEKSYWGGTMAENGCGITSMAIIASGYGLDTTPEYLRDKYFPHLDAEKMISAFADLGLKCSDFYFSSTQISKRYMGPWLREGNPILICVNSTRENMWTTASHYMVILDINKDGEFYISNPNGEEGSERASGWYEAAEIIPFIAKAAFIEPLETSVEE